MHRLRFVQVSCLPAQRRHGVQPRASRRRPDYASRRSGSQEENHRRSTDFRRSSDNGQDSRYGASGSGYYQPADGAGRAVQPDPRVLKRRSREYSARRPNGDEENRRRSANFQSRSSNGSTPAPYADDAMDSGPASAARINPAVERRRSVDYASRRAGNQEENQRRRSGSFAPLSRTPASNGQSDARSPPVVPRRKSADYSARRAGSSQEENLRRRSASFASQADRREEEMDAGRRPPVAAKRRASGDYASRRAGGQEENQRRSNDFSSPRSVPSDTRTAMPPRESMSPLGFRQDDEGYSDDYGERRYDRYDRGYGDPRAPAIDTEYGHLAPSENGSSASHKPRRESRKFSGRTRSRSREFVPAIQSVHMAASDAEFDDSSASEAELSDVKVTQSQPDIPRLVAINLPASFVVLASAVATDVMSDYSVTRFFIRYGGPGAPIFSVVPFWIIVVMGVGFFSTLLTSLLMPESYVLKGNCPECDAENKAFFSDMLGMSGSRRVTVECQNCMADLLFELGSNDIVLQKTSVEKKQDALERGRRRAVEEAKRAAQEARRTSGDW